MGWACRPNHKLSITLSHSTMSHVPWVSGRTVFAFYLVPDFTMFAFSSAIEALRLANQVIGYQAYGRRVVSADGDHVPASSGISIAADHSLADERAVLSNKQSSHMAIICSGHKLSAKTTRQLRARYRPLRSASQPPETRSRGGIQTTWRDPNDQSCDGHSPVVAHLDIGAGCGVLRRVLQSLPLAAVAATAASLVDAESPEARR